MRIAQITWLLPLIVGIVFTGSLLAQNSSVPQSTDQHQTTNQPAQTSDATKSGGSMAVPAGTEIVVRTDEAIQSTAGDEGHSYSGTVQEAVTDADGQVLIPKGSDGAWLSTKRQVAERPAARTWPWGSSRSALAGIGTM